MHWQRFIKRLAVFLIAPGAVVVIVCLVGLPFPKSETKTLWGIIAVGLAWVGFVYACRWVVLGLLPDDPNT